MARALQVILVLAVSATLFVAVDSKYVSGTAKAKKAVPYYIGKFCYSTDEKRNHFTYKTSKTSDGTYLAMYIDTSESYGAVRKGAPNISCEERIKGAPVGNGQGHAIELPTPEGKAEFVPTNSRRPRFWRVYALNCDEDYETNYELTFYNPGNDHFSHDEKGIVWLYVVCSFGFAVLLTIWVYGTCQLKQMMEYVHPIIKLFTIVITCQFGSTMTFALQYIIYAFNGQGTWVLVVIARLMEMATVIVFTFFLICLAKGWTVTTSVLTQKWLILIGFAVYVFLYVILIIWNMLWSGDNSPDSSYFYQEIPGILLLVVRAGSMVWFLVCLLFTIKTDMPNEKRVFFIVYGIVGTVWFISLPIIVTIAAALDPWVRQIIVESIFQVVQFLWMTVFVYLLWPSRAEYYFRISASEYLKGAIANDEL